MAHECMFWSQLLRFCLDVATWDYFQLLWQGCCHCGTEMAEYSVHRGVLPPMATTLLQKPILLAVLNGLLICQFLSKVLRLPNPIVNYLTCTGTRNILLKLAAYFIKMVKCKSDYRLWGFRTSSQKHFFIRKCPSLIFMVVPTVLYAEFYFNVLLFWDLICLAVACMI